MVHSIWRTKFWKISNVLGNNWYPRVFRVASYESAVRLGKFKMADQVWMGKFWKHLNFLEKKWFIRVFRVTDYESAVRLGKFKMAAQFNRQNWYTRVFRVADNEDSILQFLKCPIQNCKTKKNNKMIILSNCLPPCGEKQTAFHIMAKHDTNRIIDWTHRKNIWREWGFVLNFMRLSP